jgi:hypothetical protein
MRLAPVSLDISDRTRSTFATVGAFTLAVGGFVHLCLYRHGYRSIPDIGKLFAANVVASALAAGALLLRRDLVVRLAGLAIAIGTLAAFAVSRTSAGLLHFREVGLLPAPQAGVALIAEMAAFVILGATVAWDLSERAGRWLAAAALVGVAAVHVADLPNQLHGAGYIAAGYVALIAASIVLAVRLLTRPTEWEWNAALALGVAAVMAYVASRTVGLPLDGGDIGNWAEPLGIAALLTEAGVALIAVGHRRPAPAVVPVRTREQVLT